MQARFLTYGSPLGLAGLIDCPCRYALGAVPSPAVGRLALASLCYACRNGAVRDPSLANRSVKFAAANMGMWFEHDCAAALQLTVRVCRRRLWSGQVQA